MHDQLLFLRHYNASTMLAAVVLREPRDVDGTCFSSPASPMNGLLARIFLPYFNKTKGMQLSASATNANKLLAH